VGGGLNTTTGTSQFNTVGGGWNNNATGGADTIGGGEGNNATAQWATLGGGEENTVSGSQSTVSGGSFNTASGNWASVGGGFNNTASGDYSFAAGQQASALNKGAFVWADSQNASFSSTASDQFSVRAQGGVRFTSASSGGNQTVAWTPGTGSWSFSSDRNLKNHFKNVDTVSVLDKVAQLPVFEWSYKGYPQRHIGAMAQDFHQLFPLNDNDKALNDADLHGVELAALKGLNQKLEKTRAENAELKQQNDSLAARLNDLEATVKQLAAAK
jgi:hypothetical protein